MRQSRDIYNVAEQIKHDGDAAWLDGDFEIAAYKYGQATGFWDQVSAGIIQATLC